MTFKKNFLIKACRTQTSRRGGGNNRGRRQGRGRKQITQQKPREQKAPSRNELRRQGRCFSCKQKGHLSKDCSKKAKKD